MELRRHARLSLNIFAGRALVARFTAAFPRAGTSLDRRDERRGAQRAAISSARA